MVFRSNSMFDQNLECSILKYAPPITKKIGSRVQNFIVIVKVHFKPKHGKFWSNFEFDRYIVRGDGRQFNTFAPHARETSVNFDMHLSAGAEDNTFIILIVLRGTRIYTTCHPRNIRAQCGHRTHNLQTTSPANIHTIIHICLLLIVLFTSIGTLAIQIITLNSTTHSYELALAIHIFVT